MKTTKTPQTNKKIEKPHSKTKKVNKPHLDWLLGFLGLNEREWTSQELKNYSWPKS